MRFFATLDGAPSIRRPTALTMTVVRAAFLLVSLSYFAPLSSVGNSSYRGRSNSQADSLPPICAWGPVEDLFSYLPIWSGAWDWQATRICSASSASSCWD